MGANAGNVGQITSQGTLAPQFTVVRNGKPMSLVSESLEEVKSRILSSEADRLGSVGTKDYLITFRQRGKGHIGHADFVERTAGGSELTLSAVDDEQIRERALLIHAALEVSRDDLRHRPVIVVSQSPLIRICRYSLFFGAPFSNTTALPTVSDP